MRRSVLIVGATMVALVGVAPSGWAAESITDGNWAGSALTAPSGPARVDVSQYTLAGSFKRQGTNPPTIDRQVKITLSATPARGGACAIAPVTLPTASTPRDFSYLLPIPCNGTYTLAAKADTTENTFLSPESATLDRTVVVAAPAPKVTGVTATAPPASTSTTEASSSTTSGAATTRSITVTWDDMIPVATDVSGYIVKRKIDDGSYVELATTDSDKQSYVDADLPAAAGEATYRIYSTRPSSDGPLVSAASSSSAATFAAAPPTTTTTIGGGGGGGGDAGGGDDAGSAGAGGQAAPAAKPGAGGSRPTVRAPSLFAGTFLPPLLRPAVPATTTTIDSGFGETLPYDPVRDALNPDSAMASIAGERQANRSMAIPVATALVLAIWAFHLRTLARAARPLDTD